MGIEVYATRSSGIGGLIRHSPDDFIVREILVDGSEASLDHHEGQVLNSSSITNRYLICVLVKRDWDNFLALKTIARQLNVRANQIQIAGIKDARAVTAQHVTIEGVSAEEIKKICAEDLRVFPLGYLRSKISSYFLLGNHFRIVIRGISNIESVTKRRLDRTIEELDRIGGAPNFFGHQRFGTIRSITHLVGKAMVQGNFKKAAMIFLAKPGLHEHPDSRQVREQLQKTQNFQQALKDFSKKLHYERLMLRRLTQKPDDFIYAFRSLPEKLRSLFVQGYQSYLFNKSISRRIKTRLPLDKAEVGDLVVSIDRSGMPMLRMRRIVNMGVIAEVNRAVQAGKMRLVVPLIGFKHPSSQGIQGEIEQQILEEEKIAPRDFRISAMPEISTRGTLRSAVVPLNNFSLNKTSKDRFDPSKLEASLSFMLHRGSYATVVLREIMKPRNPVKAGF